MDTITTAMRTRITYLTQAELIAEVLQCIPLTYVNAVLPGQISRALLEKGINCPVEELVHLLAALHREGTIAMLGVKSLLDDQIFLRFYCGKDDGFVDQEPGP